MISNQTLTRELIGLFVRLLDSKKLLIILTRLGLRNRAFVYRFRSPTAFLKYNGAGGSRTHVQTSANIFVYNHRLCIVLTAP